MTVLLSLPLYPASIGSGPPLAPEREALVHAHLALVEPVAWNLSCRCQEEMEDLVQVGRLGLVTAALRFDPGRGALFKPFANTSIRGAILHHVRDRSHPVRPPRRLIELGDRVVRCQWRYRKQHGAEPTLKQLERELGVSVAILEEATVHCRRRPLSLSDRRVAEPHSRDISPEDAVWADQCVTLMRVGLAELEQEARSLLVAVYYHKRSLRSLARDAATNPMLIHRKVKRAEAQLRRVLETRGFRSEQLWPEA